MTILSMIVAHAADRIIGRDNDMPWHLPADLAYFKKTTLGKPVIMGRKTFESIGRPLPGRLNIVISRDPSYEADGITTVNSVEQALDTAKGVEEIMVIGGGAIYQHCLPKADRLYITHIDGHIAGDTRFPEYDNDWKKVSCETRAPDDKNAYALDFCVYERR
ncbi:type 3 dihydrofolate reductase [Thalassotalea sp. 1_MG-2023]|uniref:type 3 dihydrofolate reductase n=1 Tax=Thalassotalea sp. 1_MG-2023 TaxID=3062680 RepID=UPI0026E37CF3|nr:type 3 dihydrofolate reductase [Thalassotalea sp. 1_MG-2023]MDO6427090.1 type 3 dihydrofolate reductase [Thalassotalea sp. 1_MG-2023]